MEPEIRRARSARSGVVLGLHTEGGPKCAHCSQGCEVRRCVLDKKYCTCADCVEYPCAKTAFTVSEVPATRALLEALKKF